MAWIREEKKPGKQQYLAPLLLMPRGESFLPIYAKARGDSQAGLCASKEKDPPGRPAWLSQNRLAPAREDRDAAMSDPRTHQLHLPLLVGRTPFE
ncbi:hypothetical protein ZWY2020_059300 [Hordeum vulgare]|nr:hypothetical protein ZWY2020_059300 [Hordeum vulgare]